MKSLYDVRKMFTAAQMAVLRGQLIVFNSFKHVRFINSSCQVLHKESKLETRSKQAAIASNRSSQEDDPDFYGFSESDLSSEVKVSDVDRSKLEDLDPHDYAELARKRYGPNSQLEAQLPFGMVRFDKRKVDLDVLGVVSKSEKTDKRKSRRKHLNLENSSSQSQDQYFRKETLHLDERLTVENVNCDATKMNVDIETGRSSFLDEQFFPEVYVRDSSASLDELTKEGKSKFMEETVETGHLNMHSIPVSKEIHSSQIDSHKNIVTSSPNFIEDQYFVQDYNCHKSELQEECTNSSHGNMVKDRSNFIENQYFVPENESGRSEIQKEHLDSSQVSEPYSFIDDQYFSTGKTESSLDSPQSMFGRHYDTGRGVLEEESLQDVTQTIVYEAPSDTDREGVQKPSQQLTGKLQKRNKDTVQKAKYEKSAYDVSREVRKQLDMHKKSNLYGVMNPKEYDSMGMKILTMQVPHLQNMPSLDVVQILRENIIYNDNDIVAINKPYGFPSHGGPSIHNSVGRFLQDIIPSHDLHLVHRLDKETTGVMLLAKSKSMYDRLKDCFRKRNVQKRYLAITKNTPKMENGLIDIPIAEGSVTGKGRMVLRPYNTRDVKDIDKRRQSGINAKTAYRVLGRGNGCAVVECLPITGLKHQVRVHLAFGLNCPILGDHKYAHIDRMAPMRLHPDMLEKLKIRQSKVRHLAMHLHARSVMIPEFLDGKNLFISASLPLHFVCNMRALKLKLPSSV